MVQSVIKGPTAPRSHLQVDQGLIVTPRIDVKIVKPRCVEVPDEFPNTEYTRLEKSEPATQRQKFPGTLGENRETIERFAKLRDFIKEHTKEERIHFHPVPRMMKRISEMTEFLASADTNKEETTILDEPSAIAAKVLPFTDVKTTKFEQQRQDH